MLARMWSNRNSHSLLVGKQNDTDSLEDSLALCYKTKHTLYHRSQQLYSWVFTQNTWKHMFTEAQFITAKTYSRARYPSVGGWINKLWYIQTMEYYSTLKKKWAIISWKNMEEPLMHITKWKKPIWKGYILYDFNYMTLWKRQNYADSKKISGCGRGGKWIGRFLGQWGLPLWLRW